MNEIYSVGMTKTEFVAKEINSFINELVQSGTDGCYIVKDRVFISIIGYGGKCGDSVDEIRSDFISKYADRPLRMEVGKQNFSDGNERAS